MVLRGHLMSVLRSDSFSSQVITGEVEAEARDNATPVKDRK